MSLDDMRKVRNGTLYEESRKRSLDLDYYRLAHRKINQLRRYKGGLLYPRARYSLIDEYRQIRTFYKPDLAKYKYTEPGEISYFGKMMRIHK